MHLKHQVHNQDLFVLLDLNARFKTSAFSLALLRNPCLKMKCIQLYPIYIVCLI